MITISSDLVDRVAWSDFCSHARFDGCEISLEDLFAKVLDDSVGPLEAHAWLSNEIRANAISSTPPIDQGNLTDVRLFRGSGVWDDGSPAEAAIALGEHQHQEFKSSLWFDRQRAAHDQSANLSDLKSEKVLRSALKTVGAFANADGGVLWLGVGDDRTVHGLADDFELLGVDSFDSLENHFRSLLRTRFRDGTAVNDYVSIARVSTGGREIMRVSVRSRRAAITIYDPPGNAAAEVFVRQGVTTVALEVHELPEFVLRRFNCRGSATG